MPNLIDKKISSDDFLTITNNKLLSVINES